MTPDNKPSKGPEQMKKVIMPSQEIMITKLREAKLFGQETKMDEFYEHLTKSLSNRGIVSVGLMVAWELTGADVFTGYPPMVKVVMDEFFNDAIDAITPDPEVATQAKQLRQEAIKKRSKESA